MGKVASSAHSSNDPTSGSLQDSHHTLIGTELPYNISYLLNSEILKDVYSRLEI